MFSFNLIMEKVTGSSAREKSHFEEGQIIKAPLAPATESGPSESSTRSPEVLVEWRISSIDKDGLVHIMRELTPEEQGATGVSRPNIVMARTCKIEDLVKWN